MRRLQRFEKSKKSCYKRILILMCEIRYDRFICIIIKFDRVRKQYMRIVIKYFARKLKQMYHKTVRIHDLMGLKILSKKLFLIKHL